MDFESVQSRSENFVIKRMHLSSGHGGQLNAMNLQFLNNGKVRKLLSLEPSFLHKNAMAATPPNMFTNYLYF